MALRAYARRSGNARLRRPLPLAGQRLREPLRGFTARLRLADPGIVLGNIPKAPLAPEPAAGTEPLGREGTLTRYLRPRARRFRPTPGYIAHRWTKVQQQDPRPPYERTQRA